MIQICDFVQGLSSKNKTRKLQQTASTQIEALTKIELINYVNYNMK